MAAFYESDDRSVVEFQLGNKQLFFLFLGLLVICAIFFFIGLRVGEDTAKGKIPFDLGGGGPAETSTNLAQSKAVEEKQETRAEQLRTQKSEPSSRAALNPVENSGRKPSTADKESAKESVTEGGQKEVAVEAGKAETTEVKASLSGRYYLQVSSQTSKENADKLQKRLAATMPVMVEEAVVNGKTYYRVLVGPFDTREEAEEIKPAVQSSFPKAFVQKK